MPFLTSVLFGISASLDSLIIGIAYGIRGITIPFWQNIFIGIITLLGTYLAMISGNLILPFFPQNTSVFFGSFFLLLFGIWYLLKFFTKKILPSSKKKKPQKNNLCKLTFYQLILLGMTLSFNNVGIGLSASISGFPFFSSLFCTLFFSTIFLGTGNKLGKYHCLQTAGNFADPISGLLLICLGIVSLLW